MPTADPAARVVLYRAVGPDELELIRAGGRRAFPRRVHHEPMISITPDQAVARRVAREWNVADRRPGYVVRFEVDAAWLARFPLQDAERCPEHWIPNEEIGSLNAHIAGTIEVVASLRPPPSARCF